MNQVFVDMAVENLEKSMVFYTQIGFSNNAIFSDDRQNVWSGLSLFM